MKIRWAFWLAVLGCACSIAVATAAEGTSPLDSVHPMIGTDGHAHVYPGATIPFGAVQLSPDTRLETWDGCSGYHYSDKWILGFSHTHLSGTGCADLCDIRFIPLSGEFRTPEHKDGYHQNFSHDNETARPGYYSVTFDDPKIKVELSATARVGFHRYTFPAEAAGHLAIDLERGNPNRAKSAEVTRESATVISGYRHSDGWAKDKTFYFVAEFSRPFESLDVLDDGKSIGDTKGKGKKILAHLAFAPSGEPLLVKVGISAVSVEGARKNLKAEIPAWDFAGTIAAAQKQWSDYLGKIEIDTQDPAVRETFYTALYHAAMAPVLFNDVDGTYMGQDHKPHEKAPFQNYCTFSLWDTFRAEHPLLNLVQPQRVDDFINSMLAHYKEFNQHSLPVWSLAGNETWCMIGNHAISVIAEAYAKGFRGFDAEAVFQAVRDTSLQERNLLGQYAQLGYVSSEDHHQSVSRSLEYAYNDWCVAQMAQLLGKQEDAKKFSQRSQNYRHLFDTSIGFMRGKQADGTWREPFDPKALMWEDFTEATSWNYTWFVPQDVSGLIGLMGGDQPFNEKLDKMYAEDSKLLASIPDLTGLIGQYIHGNEPCHHIAYLYCYAGNPWQTQQRVREIMTTLYNNKVDGICGNDDCGQTSAWYVLSAMGFYPVSPVSGVYVLGSPAVDRATIHLDGKYFKGKAFTLIAKNNSPQNVYIQSATLNGKPLDRCWFTHAELSAGGELVVTMGPEPNKNWGKAADKRPPNVAPELASPPIFTAPAAQSAKFSSGQKGIDAAYRKAQGVIAADIQDGAFLAGANWAQVWTRDSSYSVDLACALLHPDVSKKTLLGLGEKVEGIGDCWYQDKCGHFGGWPNLTDAIVGASGAWSLYLVTGDESLLRPVYDRTVNSLRRAERDAFNKEVGLFGGCSSFMESNSGYPKKYEGKGDLLAKTYAMSTNMLHYRGYVVAGLLAERLKEDPAPWKAKAEQLKKAINDKLWIADKGYYAYYLDADGKLDGRMEGSGEAFAILYQVADAEKAARILKETPMSPTGCPCLWPQYKEWKNYKADFTLYYHNGMVWPFVQGYWAWAASQQRDVATFERELQALTKLSEGNDTFMEFYFPEKGKPGGSPRQLWSAAGYLSMVYHGLFGMDFTEEGIRFAPCVPDSLPKLSLSNLAYRKSQVSIELKGTGTQIKRFAIDGTAQADPLFPARLSGEHRIEIELQAAP